MRVVLFIALFSPFIFLAGCASKERVFGNIYEGLKTREMIAHPQIDQNPSEKSMDYQLYETERKKLLENNENK